MNSKKYLFINNPNKEKRNRKRTERNGVFPDFIFPRIYVQCVQRRHRHSDGAAVLFLNPKKEKPNQIYVIMHCYSRDLRFFPIRFKFRHIKIMITEYIVRLRFSF